MNILHFKLHALALYYVVIFCIMLVCFPVVLACFHTHSRGILMLYGTVGGSRQWFSLHIGPQCITLFNFRVMLCSVVFEIVYRKCIASRSFKLNAHCTPVLHGFLKPQSWDPMVLEGLMIDVDMLCNAMTLFSGIDMFTCPFWRCHGSAGMWFILQHMAFITTSL